MGYKNVRWEIINLEILQCFLTFRRDTVRNVIADQKIAAGRTRNVHQRNIDHLSFSQSHFITASPGWGHLYQQIE